MGGGTLSIIYLLGILLAIFLYQKRIITSTWVIIGIIFLFIGILLTGRIGLLLLIILAIYALTVKFVTFVLANLGSLNLIKRKSNNRWNLRILRIVGILIIILTSFYIYNYEYLNKLGSPVIDFAFEFFIKNPGSLFGIESVDRLIQKHFFLSDYDYFSLIFGKGIKPNSDVGYINFLEIYGIIGSGLLLMIYIQCLQIILHFRKSVVEAKVLMIYFLLLPIINIKQFFFTNAGSGFFIITLGIIYLLHQRPNLVNRFCVIGVASEHINIICSKSKY
jgi:hypothetical protein